MDSYREKLCDFVRENYQVMPEHLWLRWPDYVVFRHADSGKWFGQIMDVSRSRLGLDGEDTADILNVRVSDALLADFLIQLPGFFRGCHSGRGNWVSILLDGTVPFEEVCDWLGKSYLNTASKEEKQKYAPAKEWLVPANPKYYDIEHAFDDAEEILWKQGNGIRRGDTAFMYVAAPVSAILFKCEVTETDIPCHDTGMLHIRSLMRLRLQKRYRPDRFTFEVLRSEYGIFAVRGPRGVPEHLSEALR
jgi:predicted DNA-binding protein (MmcQ/YjbR family)